jgi:RNA polymerase sigma-70 factor, ECF subfamily
MADFVVRGVQPAEPLADSPTNAEDRGGPLFDVLFQEHYPRVVGMLGRLTGDHGQAEEVAADAFTKLAHHPSAPRDREGMTAWIYRVAINGGLDAARANTRRRRFEQAPVGPAGAEQLRTNAPGALDVLLREERLERVREVLGALKPRDAQLLLLRSSGLAYRELAAALGIQPGSVGTLLARAEAEFERRFRARHGDGQ